MDFESERNPLVKENARLAVFVALVAEGVLDLDDIAGRRAGELIGAHSDGDGAVEVDRVIVKDDLGPSLAAIDGKPRVLGVSVVHGAAADKVRHSLAARGAKWELGRLCGLEENLSMTIAVQLCRSIRSGLNIVAIGLVRARDRCDSVGCGGEVSGYERGRGIVATRYTSTRHGTAPLGVAPLSNVTSRNARMTHTPRSLPINHLLFRQRARATRGENAACGDTL